MARTQPVISSVSHSVGIPDGVPSSVQLLPAGKFSGRDDRGPYLNDQPDAIVQAFESWGMPIAIDYEHQSLTAADKTDPTPAAGWITAIEIRNGEVWGTVEWTERARQFLEAKEYRFLSPVFDYVKASGRVIRLVGAGLTNSPNLYLQAAARRHHTEEDTMSELNTDLCVALDLPKDSEDEAIVAHVKAMIQTAKTMTTELGLPDESDDKAIVARVKSMIETAIAGTVPAAEHRALQSRLETFEAERRTEKLELLIATGSHAGKLPPALHDWARETFAADPSKLEAYLEKAPSILNGHAVIDGKPLDSTPGRTYQAPHGYSVDEEAMSLHCKAMAHLETHPGTDYLAAVRAVSN
jgi:phage I-like protein